MARRKARFYELTVEGATPQFRSLWEGTPFYYVNTDKKAVNYALYLRKRARTDHARTITRRICKLEYHARGEHDVDACLLWDLGQKLINAGKPQRKIYSYIGAHNWAFGRR